MGFLLDGAADGAAGDAAAGSGLATDATAASVSPTTGEAADSVMQNNAPDMNTAADKPQATDEQADKYYSQGGGQNNNQFLSDVEKYKSLRGLAGNPQKASLESPQYQPMQVGQSQGQSGNYQQLMQYLSAQKRMK